MIIDDHAHLFLYEDKADEKIKENINKGVGCIVENALNIETINKVIEESKKYKIIYYALGIYPEHVEEMNEEDLNNILEFIENNKDKKFLGIGEVGLDYAHETNEDLIKKQKIYFERFLELSEKLDKPIIIHARKAENDVLDILTSYNNKRILHTFWKPSLANKAIDIGCYLSIPAIIYRDRGFQKIVKEVPIESILTETDSPFLDPLEKNINNNSWKIIYSLQKISEIKNMDIKEVEEIIFNNFKKIFNYDEKSLLINDVEPGN